jgi:HEAT repeat protein
VDFRIRAFVGPLSVLRDWRRHIPSALVVALTDDLGLVPETTAFEQDLRRHLKAEAQSYKEVIQSWGAQASKDCTIAYIFADSFEDFYSDGIQWALAWTNQQAVQSELFINDALRLLGVQVKAGEREFNAVDLGRYENTESWAAAATLDEAVRGGRGAVLALIQALEGIWKGRPGRSTARGAVLALIKALKDRGSDSVQIAVRIEAAKALGQHGPAAKEAIPALVKCAKKDGDVHVREEAIRALGLIGRDAVPDLIKLLKKSSHELTRADAATALGEIGKDAREAVPALVEALHDPDDIVRLVVARAVGKMYVADKQLKTALEALLECATSDRSESVRVSAVRTLATVGPEAVPTLIQVLKTDRAWNARADAAEELGDFGKEAREAAPALVEALRDQRVPVRIKAAEALGEIEVRDEEVVNALEHALNDDDEYVRKTAREALQRIQAADSPR